MKKVITIVALLASAAPASAQTQYYARERLTFADSTTSPTVSPPDEPETRPPAPPEPGPIRYNRNNSSRYNTVFANGCTITEDARGHGFQNFTVALEWCATVRARNHGNIYCHTQRVDVGNWTATLKSMPCTPSRSTGSAVITGEGHWHFLANEQAYSSNP